MSENSVKIHVYLKYINRDALNFKPKGQRPSPISWPFCFGRGYLVKELGRPIWNQTNALSFISISPSNPIGMDCQCVQYGIDGSSEKACTLPHKKKKKAKKCFNDSMHQ